MNAILRHSAIASILVLLVLGVSLIPSKAQVHSTNGSGNHIFWLARSIAPIPLVALNVRVGAGTSEQKISGYMNTYEHRVSILIVAATCPQCEWRSQVARDQVHGT